MEKLNKKTCVRIYILYIQGDKSKFSLQSNLFDYLLDYRGDSLIVGFTPEEALERTITALQTGNPCTVNPNSPVHMQ